VADTAEPTILVVDDDVGIATAIRHVLSENGTKCILATSCQDAAEVVGDARFLGLPIHGVLTDVRLPDGLGYRLIDLYRQRSPSVPIAVMTAYADDQVLDWLRERGVPFLQKPFRVSQLLEWVELARAYAGCHSPGHVDEEESWQLKLA
jgi:two-component system, NtrC family, response regulator PilR